MGIFDTQPSGNWWDNLPGQSSTDGQAPWTSQILGQFKPDFTGLGDTGGPANMANNPDVIRNLLKLGNSSGGTSVGQPGGRAADLSSILGAFSSGEKANRYMRGLFTQGYDKNMLDAQHARNLNETDAANKLASTSYIIGGGSKFKPPTLSIGGKTYQTPDLGFGPPLVSDAEKAGATTLQSQLQARLSPGGSYVPQPLDSYAKPGLAENIGSYGAAGVGGLGAIDNMMGGDGDNSSGLEGGIKKASGLVGSGLSMAKMLGLGGKGAGAAFDTAGNFVGPSSVTGAGSTMGSLLGKAVPLAGAALGTYGLAKNQSVGSDVMSGMGAGASIGSFAGPIGTGVGAGIGALVGALRGAFSVTGKEHAGRDAQSTMVDNLSALATPAQQAEAAKAGWPDPKQALSHIILRDKFTQSGMSGQDAEAKASSIQHGMWDAEKHGAQAVNQAASPIQSMMSQGPMGSRGGSSGLVTDAFSQGARG